MKVETVLRNKPSRIVMVRVNETIATAAKMLSDEDVGALIVKDVCRSEGNVVIGMLSERDIVRALVRHGAPVLKMKVADLMSPHVISCRPEDTLESVRDLMTRHRIRHVPVFESGTLIGLVSIRDLIDYRIDAMDANAA